MLKIQTANFPVQWTAPPVIYQNFRESLESVAMEEQVNKLKGAGVSLDVVSGLVATSPFAEN